MQTVNFDFSLEFNEVALTKDQEEALKKLLAWWNLQQTETGDAWTHRSFLIDGAAGTGKTFCLQRLFDTIGLDGKVLFTAPTNKAVRVLQQTLRKANINGECCTTYSALGLKMTPNGEVKILTQAEKGKTNIDWKNLELVVVDEASMVGFELKRYIDNAQRMYGVPVLYLGDQAQLPPVGEGQSAAMIAASDEKATLNQVVRQDNQILTLATEIRQQVFRPFPSMIVKSDNDGEQGVWRTMAGYVEQEILRAADDALFFDPEGARCIAWRNAVVNKLNALVRSRLFPDTDKFFCPEDRIILAAPVQEISTSRWPVIHTTDTEGVVKSVELDTHPEFPDYVCWHIKAQSDDGAAMDLWTLNTDDKINVQSWKTHKEQLYKEAKSNPRRWDNFWTFIESFHSVRHGYALTAHRSQGSTYQVAFVNYSDIFCNRDKGEAFKCFYVACTRPKRKLYLW